MHAFRDPKAFWNFRAETYDAQSGVTYAAAYNKTLERILHYVKPDDRVLDFACGTGLVSLRLAPQVAQLTAIDISTSMIEKANEKLSVSGDAAGKLTFLVLDLFSEKLPRKSFDVVLACNVLLYLKNREQVLSRIRELLKPGGLFLSATDCLGEGFSREGLRKWWKSHTGQMPFVSFDSRTQLTDSIRAAGFSVLETETLFQTPPNVFVAAEKRNA